MSGLRKGREHLQRAATRGGGDYTGSRWFYWEDGETKALRFLTDADDIITVFIHEQIPTHDDKKKSFVCRQEFGEKCELCDEDYKRRERGYGIAVWREEVRENGKLAGYEDKTEEEEVEENGKTRKKIVPWVGIVAQGPKNFWSRLDAAFDKYGTLRDRDFELMRRGKSTDTDYHLFPADPLEIPDIDERYANYMPDVEAMLTRMGSAEYYDKHLRGISADGDDKKEQKASGDDDSLPSDEEELARLKKSKEKVGAYE